MTIFNSARAAGGRLLSPGRPLSFPRQACYNSEIMDAHMSLSQVAKLRTVNGTIKANKLLDEGWTLIGVSVSGVVWQFCLARVRDSCLSAPEQVERPAGEP